ncbi:flavohemoglobin expression-modulating QEGLA motif protein [Pricia sp.]|uniref:flavohemoglobin expression-modulating QEGLA motif protein n=1 Tax=Pricia sp. TaxID=2268138 RepID=UPI003593195B
MIEKRIVRNVCKKLSEAQSVFQKLPKDGVMYIEKLLPYICVFRYKREDAHFAGLLKTQASYLVVEDTVDISKLLEEISSTVSQKLNAFLILEFWPVRKDHQAEFEIFCPENKAPATVAALQQGFESIRDIYPNTSVTITNRFERHPERLEPLMAIDESKESGSLLIGVAVPALYQNIEEEEVYSLFYRKFFSRFSETIKRAAYEFIRVQTSNPFDHYLMLGKTHLDRVTLKADAELAKISEGMKFLLRTTPVNSTPEWKKFKKNNFLKTPSFNYRLIALDPEKKKRELYALPIDQVTDPTISFILRDKRLEIEKQLTMLEERGTDNFRFIGESLYGKIEDHIIEAALAILKQYPKGDDRKDMRRFNCHEFAEQAKQDMAYYQERFPDIKLSMEIRKDVAGIMVSKSELLISDQFSLDQSRCDALIQHEIATHILTYCNGKSQPLKQMYAGFSGYDQLQEGLAVLAEYLVDGLTVNRMRTLAGRVVAAESMVKGANFIATFDRLRTEHNFTEKTAYYITMRIYRGGGLVKDFVYLAGLLNVMGYLKNGGNLETLYSGKFNINHVELIEELLHRSVLRKPILPRFLERDSVKKRLQKVRNGLKITELLA